MARPSAHPEFKRLQAEWNQKLQESGFKDLEYSTRDGPALKKTGTERRYEHLDSTRREAKEEFFERVSQNVRRTPIRNQISFRFLGKPRRIRPSFESEQEFYILSLYAQGFSKAEIQRRLGIEGHRCKVYYPIYHWLKIWGLKK